MPTGVHAFPTIQINGKEPWTRDYDTIMEALCATGISAGACGAGPHPSPTPVPTPPPSGSHYGKPPCKSDETSIEVGSAVVCAPACSDACPKDTPGQGSSIFDPS